MTPKVQFFNIRGYPRGGRAKRGTLGSVIAEGLREPTHVSHLLRPPNIGWERLDSPLEHPADLEHWLISEMEEARNTHKIAGAIHHRKLRSDALAVGTFITSWPETVEVYDKDKFSQYIEKTTGWLRSLLDPVELMLHFRLDHFDEKYPHVHYWFSPFPNERRTRNWGMHDICTNGKRYYHELQVNFWESVGSEFFDQRRLPYGERSPRVSRFEAVKRREAEEREVVARTRLASPTYPLLSVALEKLDELNGSDVEGPLDLSRLTPNARNALKRFNLLPEQQALDAGQGVSQAKRALTEADAAKPSAVTVPKFGSEEVSRWLSLFLLPAVFTLVRERRSQAAHMEADEWMDFLVEETRYQLESSLSEMGLQNHPLGSEILAQFVSGAALSVKLQEVKGISPIERSSLLTGEVRLNSEGVSGEVDTSPWSTEMPR